MDREAMQMALEALESKYIVNCGAWRVQQDQAITALRQALETEQEPVAFINVEKQKLEWAKLTSWHTPTIVNLPKIPLYTAPPKREWVRLTDDEVFELADTNLYDGGKNYGVLAFAKAIEQALKEKNT